MPAGRTPSRRASMSRSWCASSSTGCWIIPSPEQRSITVPTPAYTIEEICDAMQKATGLHRHVPLVPAGLLLFAAGILGPIGGKKVGIHPARVRKLMVSTNVCGRKLAATDYKFHYTLEESFRDWFEDCDRKELV